MHKVPARHSIKANFYIHWDDPRVSRHLTFDGLLGAGLEPGQWADLGLPDEAVRVAEAELLHHQVHRGPDLGRVRVAAVHHLSDQDKVCVVHNVVDCSIHVFIVGRVGTAGPIVIFSPSAIDAPSRLRI